MWGCEAAPVADQGEVGGRESGDGAVRIDLVEIIERLGILVEVVDILTADEVRVAADVEGCTAVVIDELKENVTEVEVAVTSEWSG